MNFVGENRYGADNYVPVPVPVPLQVADCAAAAAAAIQELCRLTISRPQLSPAEVDVVLADLALAVGAIPQAAKQLTEILERARSERDLEMDTLSETADPHVAIDVARLHLDNSQVHANELYYSLDAAHNQTAHIAEGRHTQRRIEVAGPSVEQRPVSGMPSSWGEQHRQGPAR